MGLWTALSDEGRGLLKNGEPSVHHRGFVSQDEQAAGTAAAAVLAAGNSGWWDGACRQLPPVWRGSRTAIPGALGGFGVRTL